MMDIVDVFSLLPSANFVSASIRPVFEAVETAYERKRDDENVRIAALDLAATMNRYAVVSSAESMGIMELGSIPDVIRVWDQFWDRLELNGLDHKKTTVFIGLLTFLGTHRPVFDDQIQSRSIDKNAAEPVPICLEKRYEQQAAWLVVRASGKLHFINHETMRHRVKEILCKLAPNTQQSDGRFRVSVTTSLDGQKPMFTLLRAFDIAVLRNYTPAGIDSFRVLEQAMIKDEGLQTDVTNVLKGVDKNCNEEVAATMVKFITHVCRRSLFKFAIQKIHGIESGQSSLSFRGEIAALTAPGRRRKAKEST